jgi:hypothetical protein
MSLSKPISRRSALLMATKAAGFLLLPISKQSTEARIVVVSGGTAGSMGATLGIEEARHAWQLLRRPVVFEAIDASAGTEVGGHDQSSAACVVTTMDGASRDAWDDVLASSGTVHVDGAAHRMHDRMCVASRFVIGTSGDDGSKILWHSTSERYGARQLNDRFRTRFSKEMDGAEWAAWFAVKITSEALLRVGSAPLALGAYLASARTAFDGHKGRSLRFGPDHRLVQPLYVVRKGPGGDEVVEEVAQAESVAAACPTPAATS